MDFRLAVAALLTVALAPAQQKPTVIGGVSSTASVEIDGTSMAPAPSWPLVDRDVVRTTSAPGLVLTKDQNAVTLQPSTASRIRTMAPDQTWFFVREGGVALQAKNAALRICIGNRLFQPMASASGTLTLEKSGTVARTITSGQINELPVRSCGEELPLGLTALPAGAVAAGTASAVASSAAAATVSAAGVAGVATAVGVTAGLATAVGAASSASPSTCASAAGCNFNPTAITPSTP